MKKTFVLGFGAAKCGTTWMWNYFDKNNLVEFGGVKEHAFLYDYQTEYLDPITDFSSRKPLYDYQRSTKDLNARIEHNRVVRNRKFDYFKIGDSFIANEYRDNPTFDTYERFFKELSLKYRIVGDFSVQYALLDPIIINEFKSRFSDLFNIKVIFQMRDPIERIYSFSKQQRSLSTGQQHGSGKRDEGEDINYSPKELALRNIRELRNYFPYKWTIQNLDRCFDQKDILYLYYEDMFNEKTIKQVTDFIGAPYIKPDFGYIRPNPVKYEDLAHREIEEIYPHIQYEYDFALERFGYIPKKWHQMQP